MFCPRCGIELPAGTQMCSACGWQAAPAAVPIEQDPAMRILLPVGRSVYAILAGYFGLVSVLFLPAPFALLFGILALRDIRKHPEKGGKGRAMFGLIMGAIFTLLLAGLILLGVAAALDP